MTLGPIEILQRRRIIGDVDGRPPLLIRWVLLRCPWFGIYLHKLCRSDYDRALHDHPWGFWSFVLWGGYDEIFDRSGWGEYPRIDRVWRAPLSLAYRPATHRHRVVIPTGRPAWTLLLVEPRSRKWGFWVADPIPDSLAPPWLAGGPARDHHSWCHWRHFDTDRNICRDEAVWPDRDGEGDDGASDAMRDVTREAM